MRSLLFLLLGAPLLAAATPIERARALVTAGWTSACVGPEGRFAEIRHAQARGGDADFEWIAWDSAQEQLPEVGPDAACWPETRGRETESTVRGRMQPMRLKKKPRWWPTGACGDQPPLGILYPPEANESGNVGMRCGQALAKVLRERGAGLAREIIIRLPTFAEARGTWDGSPVANEVEGVPTRSLHARGRAYPRTQAGVDSTTKILEVVSEGSTSRDFVKALK